MLLHYLFIIFIGISSSMVICAPTYRPGNIPWAYCLLLLAAYFFVIRFTLLNKREIESKRKKILLVWVLPVVYMLSHAYLFNSANVIQYGARNFIPIIGGLIIIKTVETERQLTILLIGLSFFFVFDGIIGIGQYFELDLTKNISERLSESVDLIQSDRIFGIQIFAHIFAYHQGIWTLIIWWVFLTIEKDSLAKYYFFIVFLIGLIAVFLSGQRSVAWPIMPLLGTIYFFQKGLSKKLIIALFLISIIFILFLSNPIRYGDGTATRLLDFRANYSDYLRFLTWEQAVTILFEDPLWGSAYVTGVDLPVHNGLLNGWVRFGIIWLFLFFVAIRRTIVEILKYQSSIGDRVAGLSVLILIIFNSMFHTNNPGKNDMAFYIFVGLIASILYSHSKRDLFKG